MTTSHSMSLPRTRRRCLPPWSRPTAARSCPGKISGSGSALCGIKSFYVPRSHGREDDGASLRWSELGGARGEARAARRLKRTAREDRLQARLSRVCGFRVASRQQPNGGGRLRGEQQAEGREVTVGVVAALERGPQTEDRAHAPLRAERSEKQQQVRPPGDAPALRDRHDLREKRVRDHRGDAPCREKRNPPHQP